MRIQTKHTTFLFDPNYYIETDDKIFESIAYISFKGHYFTDEDIPCGWRLMEAEYYDTEKGEYNLDELDDVIEFDFPHDQDVYYFYTQQVAVFMNLYNWAKELPDISENK